MTTISAALRVVVVTFITSVVQHSGTRAPPDDSQNPIPGTRRGVGRKIAMKQSKLTRGDAVLRYTAWRHAGNLHAFHDGLRVKVPIPLMFAGKMQKPNVVII